MRISDYVAEYIQNLMDEADGIAEIQRNELAGLLGCVPSQINYVITSRFTPEHGYIVESRRGGGGYIRITRRHLLKSDFIMHIINSVGNILDDGSAKAMISNMAQNGIVSDQEAQLLLAAVSEKSLVGVPKEFRSAVRASIFKNMLLVTNV